jgi:hypothetical protein
MLIRILASCLLLAAIPSVVLAQDAKDNENEGMTNKELAEEVRLLKEQVAKLTGNLTETMTQVGDLKKEQSLLSDQINEEIVKQRQILEAISGIDSVGQRIPRISAIMDESEDFREDVRDAVHKSLQTHGDLSVTNKTGSYQSIFINRKEYGVSAGQTLTFKVPVGTVTTKLNGERLMNWTIGAPNYKESIDIVPKSAPLITVARPVYVDPPASSYIYSAPLTEYYVFP